MNFIRANYLFIWPSLLFTVLVFNQSWVPGMFHDGTLYSALGKNAALYGHWLVPKMSDTYYSQFFDLNDTFFFLSRVLIIFYLAPYLSDVHYYQWISSLLSSGKIPYINFNFEYPPLSLIPIYLPDIVTQKTSSSNFHFYRTIFHLFIFSLDLWHY